MDLYRQKKDACWLWWAIDRASKSILGWTLGMAKETDGDVTLTEIASKFGLSKADASKFSCLFRDSLTTGLDPLPLMPGQRDEKARSKFAKKRVEQEKARRIKK